MYQFYSSSSFLVTSLVLAMAVSLTGCSGSDSQVAVRGTVTFDGQPVEEGQVAFEPRGEGKMQFGIITNGNYAIPAEFGLVPGEYVVKITASRPTGQLANPDAFITDENARVINEQFIPPKYNSRSELVVTIEPGSEVTHDFALTSN